MPRSIRKIVGSGRSIPSRSKSCFGCSTKLKDLPVFVLAIKTLGANSVETVRSSGSVGIERGYRVDELLFRVKRDNENVAK